jgi:hypothetical protein
MPNGPRVAVSRGTGRKASAAARWCAVARCTVERLMRQEGPRGAVGPAVSVPSEHAAAPSRTRNETGSPESVRDWPNQPGFIASLLAGQLVLRTRTPLRAIGCRAAPWSWPWTRAARGRWVCGLGSAGLAAAHPGGSSRRLASGTGRGPQSAHWRGAQLVVGWAVGWAVGTGGGRCVIGVEALTRRW